MQRTLFEKIWEFHRVAQRADGRDLIYIDRHVLHELHAHHAFAQLQKQGRPVRRADLTFAVQDHTVATKPGRDDDTNPSGSAFIKAMREGCRNNNIRLFDVDDPEQGISHVVAPELGIVLPGATKPERPPISMLRLHKVMRCSIGMARTAAPAYSTA